MRGKRSNLTEIMAEVLKTDSCWLWQGAKNSYGYGRFVINGRRVGAHRAVWLLLRGEIPAGAWLLHRCDNPACVNPEHMFLGNHQDNMHDCAKKERFHKPPSRELPVGVHLNKPRCRKKYVARIRLNGRFVGLGAFNTIEEARAAYVAANMSRPVPARAAQGGGG